MTIKELYTKIDRISENKRMEGINNLLPLLSPLSMTNLRKFKHDWKSAKPQEFIAARSKAVKKAIEFELSYIGISTRAIQGLPYLDWDTELEASNASKFAVKKM